MIPVTWVLALVVLLVVATAVIASRISLRRQVDLERVRTRIAADLHDELGSSLSRIAILCEVARRRTDVKNSALDRTLDELAQIARDLVDTMSDVVWSIDPKRDDLRHLLSRLRRFTSDLWDAKGIAWTFDSPPDPGGVRLGPEQRRHLYLVLKEAITNVAAHSGCSHASLSVSVARGTLTAEVRDDGKGMESISANAPSTGQYRGRGLFNMVGRALSIGGKVTFTSAPGEGTRVVMTMPLQPGT